MCSLAFTLEGPFCIPLIAVDDVIKSEDLKDHCLQEIKELFDGRMISNKDLYKLSTSVQQMLDFCKEIVHNV